MKYLLLLLTLLLCLGSCRKKELKGPVRYKGIVRNGYLMSRISGIRVAMGTYYKSWTGGRNFNIRQTALTGPDGSFEFTDNIAESVVFIAIVDSLATYNRNEHLGNKYLFASNQWDNDRHFLFYDPYYAESNDEEVLITLNQFSFAKYALKRSPLLAVDTLVFNGYHHLPLVVKSDTDVFIQLRPKAINSVELKRGTFTLYKEQFNTGAAGDTSIRQIQL